MKNIAIIGSGISGLSAAYLLSKSHNVTVFEKNDYIGGHTATKTIEQNGKAYDVDTGFIVFNDRTYPNFLKLLEQLKVEAQETEMSFSVHNLASNLHYNGHDLNSLFAQRSNIFNLKFWRLLKSILRFNKLCKQYHDKGNIDSTLTLGDFLAEHKFSDFFAEHYILPMGAAIWSTSLEQMNDFQLKFFIQFFFNHGLLNIKDRPQWYVIKGGSKQYIEPLIARFKDKIKLNADVQSVCREDGKIKIVESGEELEFDEVVFACHSNQALALLTDATEKEKEVLGDIPYTPNSVVLHDDTSILPPSKRAWAAWNYRLDSDSKRPACVSYNMNILQGIQSDKDFVVTLNQPEAIDKNSIKGDFNYEHPVFNNVSMAAQLRRKEICGVNHTHFCGAYWYNGFHEDGLRSALDVTKRFGLEL